PTLIQLVIDTIITAGRDANLIRFLNNNRDSVTEASLLPALKAAALREERLFSLLNEHLDSLLMKKMGFAKTKAPVPPKPRSRPEKAKIRWLRGILVFAFLLFPVIFVIFYFNILTTGSFRDVFVTYVVMINHIFIAYYVGVNVIYLILAAISFGGARKQRRLWQLKTNGMLFERGMLASIAIIAPAYNESVTIVESVESLLNLRYPDFEVIVVNDGSGDDTLQKLIDHFSLERRNVVIGDAILTRPIRGIYVNRSIPNLTVVDKMNGGKADALNVGINVAKKEYVCGIDADSLLEADSLLKLMSTTIDHDEITLCLGGNIFPVNGCTVDHGVIAAMALPKALLARFQTIEYLRAFSLGRIGWAELDALLIISGAFGLFERRILSEVGGYLTESAFKKDTVGEDMELVVRITRHAIERKLPFRVDYVHNAECFTEVPEDGKSLLKQRNRWQRGLIDILSYHRRMIGNPKYRQPGMIAMPYFVLFETIGPLLEVQAYAAIFAGLFLGILSVEILVALMIATIVMGMILSILSLFVAERHTVHFGVKDTLLLILISILENFGWRQFWSLYRIRGYFSSLRDNFTWGEMARVGFNKGK
ncbi:MAG: glycosyltransferase family 2 protein, partial [bacterium]